MFLSFYFSPAPLSPAVPCKCSVAHWPPSSPHPAPKLWWVESCCPTLLLGLQHRVWVELRAPCGWNISKTVSLLFLHDAKQRQRCSMTGLLCLNLFLSKALSICLCVVISVWNVKADYSVFSFSSQRVRNSSLSLAPAWVVLEEEIAQSRAGAALSFCMSPWQRRDYETVYCVEKYNWI